MRVAYMYIKRQFGLETQVSVTINNVTLLRIEKKQFPLNILNFLRPIDTKFRTCVAYIKQQLKIATPCVCEEGQGHCC